MSARATRRRTASDQVSEALLSAAEAVLDREGAAGVTVRAVARQADVAPMGVYNRFDNKEGLLAALAMRALDELAVAIDVAADAAPVDRFREACRGYRTFALEHPARYALIFTAGSPLEAAESPAALRGRAVFGVLVDLVAGVADTSLADATESAQAVWSAVHGAVTLELAGRGQTPDATASFDHLLDMLVSALRRAAS